MTQACNKFNQIVQASIGPMASFTESAVARDITRSVHCGPEVDTRRSDIYHGMRYIDGAWWNYRSTCSPNLSFWLPL